MVGEQEGNKSRWWKGRGSPLYTVHHIFRQERYRKDYPAVRIHACMRVYACLSKRDSIRDKVTCSNSRSECDLRRWLRPKMKKAVTSSSIIAESANIDAPSPR